MLFSVKNAYEEVAMKVGLCLGAGGVRGMGHIGMLEVLEENGLHFDMVSGSSAGSIVGACYAAGVSVARMKEKLFSLKQWDIMDLNPTALRTNGVINGNKICNIIRDLTGDIDISECRIPFVSVCVDIVSAKTVYIDSGKLIDAVRPSFAVPGVFSAVEKDGMLLVDGGVKERMPVKILREKGMDRVLALNCCTDLIPIKRPHNIPLHVARAFDIMDWELCKHTLKEADYLVNMERGSEVVYYKISEAKKAYELGREAILPHIEEIKKLFV